MPADDDTDHGCKPAVSVVMPVFNPTPFFPIAVDSILNQTLRDLELVIVDDGSTAPVAPVLEDHDDSRLRVLRIEHSGAAAALNHGIRAARSGLIACMDADDVAMPTRLADQVRFLGDHPDVVMVGGGHEFIDTAGNVFGRGANLCHDVELQRSLFVTCPFVHSAVTFRRDPVLDIGGYDPDAPTAHDYDLWVRLLRGRRAANLATVVVRYRVHGQGMSELHSLMHGTSDDLRVVLWAHGLPPRVAPATLRRFGREYRRLGAAVGDRLLGQLLVTQWSIIDFAVCQRRWSMLLREFAGAAALAPLALGFLLRRLRHGRGTGGNVGDPGADEARALLRGRAQPLRGRDRPARVVAARITSSDRRG